MKIMLLLLSHSVERIVEGLSVGHSDFLWGKLAGNLERMSPMRNANIGRRSRRKALVEVHGRGIRKWP